MPRAAGTVLVEVKAYTRGFLAGMKQAEAQARRFENRSKRSVENVGSSFGKLTRQTNSLVSSFGLMTAALAVGLGTRSAIHQFASFEATMNNVKAVSGATGTQFALLNEKAKELGSSTKFTASQVAEAMSFMAMAGLSTSQIYDGVQHSLTLAAAGNMDLGQSADIVTNIMTALGLQTSDLSRAVDVLTKTFTSSNTTLGDLGYAFKYVAPIAKAAGLQFEEVSAALGLLGNAGMQGTLAGTALRGAIIRMISPSNEAKKALKAAGITVTDMHGRLKSLTDIIKQFEPHARNVQLFAEVFGQRAGPGMVNLVSQGSEAIQQFTASLQNAGGTAERVAKTQMEGLRGSFITMTSAAEGLSVALGESGLGRALQTVAEGATDALRAMTRFVESYKAVNEMSLQTIREQRAEVEAQLKAIDQALAHSTAQAQETGGLFSPLNRYLGEQATAGWKKLRDETQAKLEQLQEFERLQGQLRKPAYTPKPAAAVGLADEEQFMTNLGGETTESKRKAAIAALQRLESDYLASTKQTARLIQVEHDRELAKFKELLDQKLISAEQYETARQQLAVITAKKMEALNQKSLKFFQEIGQSIQGALEGALRSFVETGKIDFHELTKSILSDLAVISMRMALMNIAGAVSGGGGGGVGAGLGNILASMFHQGGTAGQAAPARSVPMEMFAAAPRVPASLFHQGGIVGQSAPKRHVPPETFLNAPRLHDGGKILKPGEVPAILRTGETVTPAGKKDSGVVVQIVNNTSGDVRQEQGRTSDGREIRRFIIEETNRAIANGQLDGTMRARYGNRVQGTRR